MDGEQKRVLQEQHQKRIEARASEEHLRLAAIVKDTHRSLREQILAGVDAETAWEVHLQDAATLHSYATAMHQLATRHWHQQQASSLTTVAASCRISWIAGVLADFFHGGGLSKQLSKDAKRLVRYRSLRPDLVSIEESLKKKCQRNCLNEKDICGNDSRMTDCQRSSLASDHLDEGASAFLSKKYSETAYNSCEEHVPPPRVNYSEPLLHVLDVGSCFNPFQQFSFLDVTAIDIAPALPSVLRCDFLTVPVIAADRHAPTIEKSGVTSLCGSSYDAVIFCLLLEYLPTPQTRFRCCKKAFDLLKENGLLMIVTPDSCHQARNQKQLTAWHKGLVALGFGRVVYQKQRHFHGLAYRRLSPIQSLLVQLELRCKSADGKSQAEGNPRNGCVSAEEDVRESNNLGNKEQSLEQREEDLEQLFFIPQDFSTRISAPKEQQNVFVVEKEGGEDNVAGFFDLLPEL